jgi:hypothetical protein
MEPVQLRLLFDGGDKEEDGDAEDGDETAKP